MRPKATTVATLGRAIASTIEDYGCDSRPLFEELGLDINQCYNPNARFDTAKVARLWRLAARTTGDPAFGLKVAQHTAPALNPAFSAAFSSSDNLLQALKRLCKMFHFVSGVGDLELTRVGDSVFLQYRMPPENRELLADEAVDALFASLVGNIRHVLDPEFAAKGIYFMRPQPAETQPYEALFKAPIYYEQDSDKLELDFQMLCKPLLSANPEIAQLNEQIILEYLKRSERDEVVQQTRFHIIAQLPYGEPSQEKIAGLMHLSTRQLRRKLQELDTNYSQVLLETRHEMAQKYLQQHKLPISEVTQLLGFTDQSNFTKAFKRWQGETPVTYRKRFEPQA